MAQCNCHCAPIEMKAKIRKIYGKMKEPMLLLSEKKVLAISVNVKTHLLR